MVLFPNSSTKGGGGKERQTDNKHIFGVEWATALLVRADRASKSEGNGHAVHILPPPHGSGSVMIPPECSCDNGNSMVPCGGWNPYLGKWHYNLQNSGKKPVSSICKSFWF